MDDNLLNIHGLTVNLKTPHGVQSILNKINLQIKKGQTHALVGESGGGKTFTIRSIVGLFPDGVNIDPVSQVNYAGRDLLRLSDIQMQQIRAHEIGVVFQEPIMALDPVFQVGQQISEVLRANNSMSAKQAKHKTLELLTEVGLDNPQQYYHLYPHQLSGGIAQRVMIAIAIANEPNLLIADEPTSSLDPIKESVILQLLKKIQQKRQMTILLVTHDLNVVKRMADVVSIIHEGTIVESASVSEFFAGPKHKFSRELLEASQLTHSSVSTQTDIPLLTIKNLEIDYPIKHHMGLATDMFVAVNNVSFTIHEGESLALIGESGSGKSTIAKAIVGLEHVARGDITLAQQSLVNLNHRNRIAIANEIQIVFQDPFSSLNPRMLVGEIIAEGLLIQHKELSAEAVKERVDELLLAVGLDPRSQSRYPHEFSGGQRQRICIARALAMNPHLIICDEITSALDVDTQLQILKLLKTLQQQRKLSYLVITHNLREMSYLADNVAVISHGQILEYAPLNIVLTKPTHPYTRELLASKSWK